MLVLFAHWCPKCNMMMPIVDELEDYYNEKLQVLRIDIEKNPEVMEEYKAEIVPTFIFYKQTQEREEIEVGRMAGMIGEKMMYQRIEALFSETLFF